MGFGQSKPEEMYPVEYTREPGYTHDYDEEVNEEKKIVTWHITYGKPNCCGRRQRMTHEIEDGPETEEEFKEWMRFPIPKKAREAIEKTLNEEDY